MGQLLSSIFKEGSEIASHITLLNQKEVLIVWEYNCEESFKKLKTLLTLAPILNIPSEGNDFIVFYDAPWLGLGDVLMQDQDIIAYVLMQLKTYEKNYPTYAWIWNLWSSL